MGYFLCECKFSLSVELKRSFLLGTVVEWSCSSFVLWSLFFSSPTPIIRSRTVGFGVTGPTTEPLYMPRPVASGFHHHTNRYIPTQTQFFFPLVENGSLYSNFWRQD